MNKLRKITVLLMLTYITSPVLPANAWSGKDQMLQLSVLIISYVLIGICQSYIAAFSLKNSFNSNSISLTKICKNDLYSTLKVSFLISVVAFITMWGPEIGYILFFAAVIMLSIISGQISVVVGVRILNYYKTINHNYMSYGLAVIIAIIGLATYFSLGYFFYYIISMFY